MRRRRPMADSGAKLVEPVVFQGVHASLPHDSALRHVSGAAIYVDDIPEPAGMLHVHLRMGRKTYARSVSMVLAAVRASPGVVTVLTARDIPGESDVSPVIHADKLFA